MSTGYIPKELRERVARQAQFDPAEAAVEKMLFDRPREYLFPMAF